MKYRIRQSHDAFAIAGLDSLCFPGDEPVDPLKGWWCIAYSEEGKAVGYCGLIPVIGRGDALYLHRVGVIPGHRGARLQIRLVRAAVKHAWKNESIIAVISSVMNWNIASLRNLLKCGFKPYWPNTPWLVEGGVYLTLRKS